MRFASHLLVIVGLALQVKSGPKGQPDLQGQQVVMNVGDQAEVDGGRFRVRFQEVISDSRCPRGHQCISAGQAKVRVWIEEGSNPGRSHMIAGPARVFHSVSKNYSIQMKSLEPYPEASVEKLKTQTLTLVIRELSPAPP